MIDARRAHLFPTLRIVSGFASGSAAAITHVMVEGMGRGGRVLNELTRRTRGTSGENRCRRVE